MTEKEKRKAIRHYFKKFPRWTFLIIGIGVSLCATADAKLIALGLAIASLGAVPIYLYFKKMISDELYKQFRNEDLAEIVRNRSVKKWNVLDQNTREEGDSQSNDEQLVKDSVYVYAPSGDINSGTTASKRGKDGFVKYNPIHVAVIGFGRHQLFAYIGHLDMFTGNVLNESTEEFFYRDVVSVSTKTRTVRFQWNGVLYQMNDTETFILTTSGGTEIAVPIRSNGLASIMGGGDIPITEAEQTIASVRKVLREKKQVEGFQDERKKTS